MFGKAPRPLGRWLRRTNAHLVVAGVDRPHVSQAVPIEAATPRRGHGEETGARGGAMRSHCDLDIAVMAGHEVGGGVEVLLQLGEAVLALLVPVE